MSEEKPISIALTAESVNTIIQANVKSAVLDAMLKNGPQFITGIVSSVLLAEDRNSYNSRGTVLDSIIRKHLEAEVQKAMQDYLAQNTELIRKELDKVIRSRKYNFAGMFVEALTGLAKENWRMNVTVTNRNS